MSTMLEIVNAALQSQGLDPVAENDGTPEYAVLSRNWPLILEAELEDGAYHFTRSERELLTRQEGKFGYSDAYLLPAAALFVRKVWVTVDGERYAAEWTQDGRRVHLNSETGCTAEIVQVDDLDDLSGNFARAMQMKLEAVILRALKEEASEARDMEERAEIHFQRARTNSSKRRSEKRPYTVGRLARARFGG